SAKPEKKETKSPERKETKSLEREETNFSERKETKIPEREETKSPERKETKAPEKKETKIPEEKATKTPEKRETKAPKKGETEIPEDPAEMDNLILRFQIYESSQQNITQIFSYWDRVQGTLQLPVIQKRNKAQPLAENKDQKTNKPQEKVEKKPEQKCEGHKSLQSSQLETQSKVAEGAVRDCQSEHIGVPCLDIQVTNPKTMIREILRDGRLPMEDQMPKHLELHPTGLPLSPSAVLSMGDHPEEQLGSAERGRSAKGRPKTGKVASRDNSLKKNQISTQRTKNPLDCSTTRSKSTLKSASASTEFLR
ncbi:SPRR3 protein, partial [Certhia familiaris]|nr:SPRR3 protein [Certhia familiaris]